MSGAYYIRWQNRTFAEALHYDNTVVEGSRKISPESMLGLAWYCWYLVYTTTGFAQANCTLPYPPW